MDFTAEAMQKTLDIANPVIHEVEDAHGVTANYSTKKLFEVEAKAPEPPSLVRVATLTGFADLVRAELEAISNFKDYLIHIEDECTFTLKRKESDEYGRRTVLVHAHPLDFQKFRFGEWHTQEAFAIAVASLFAETEDKQYVLNMASSLTDQATSNSEDDGFTQKATVKRGLVLKAEVTLKPRVALAPYRTFPEITQPVSNFIFRARSGEGMPTSLMLVEADGGRWKVDAIQEIRKALEAFDLGIPIIA